MNIKDIKGLTYIGKPSERNAYKYTYRGIKFYVYADICGKAEEVSGYFSPHYYKVDNSSAHFSKRHYYKLYRKDRLKTLGRMIDYNFHYLFQCRIGVIHKVLWRVIKYQFSYLKLLIKY